MKNFIVLLFYISSLITPIPSFAQVGVVEGFYAKNISAPTNYVLNTSCGLNTKDIVSSQAGTLTRRSTGGLLDGKDCAFDATALGQTIKWNLKQYDTALKNQQCMTSFTYQYAGASSDYRAYIERGGVEITNTSILLQTTGTDVREQSIYHPCGDLTQATKPVIVSAVANPGPIYAVFMDSKKSNQQTIIDAPEWVGTVTFGAGTALNISNTSYAETIVAVSGITYAGRLSAPSVANRIGFVINSGLPGRYVMVASGIYTQSGFGLSATNTFGSMSFGYSELGANNDCGYMSGSTNETGVHDALSQADFSCGYTSTVPLASKDFWIKHKVNISTAQAVVRANARIDVYRYPTVNSSATSIGIPEAVQYVGEVFPVATTTCPVNSLIANGAAISRTTESDLFAAIGTTHGQGDGSTTFNLPDYRGRFLRGVDGGTGRDPNAASRTTMNAGGNTGNAVGSVQEDALQSHGHGSRNTAQFVDSSQFYGGGLNAPLVASSGSRHPYTSQTQSGTAAATGAPTDDGTGGTTRTSTESRPKNAYVNFCIRTKTTRLTANLLTGNEITNISSSYSVLANDNHIIANATSGNITATLPAANAANKGKIYKFSVSSTVNNTLTVSSTSQICYNNTSIVVVPGSITRDEVTLQSDGTQWIGLHGSCQVTRTALVSATGVVSEESHNWINGNCTNAVPYVCTFITGSFSTIPFCQVMRNIVGFVDTPGISALSAASLAYSFHRTGTGEVGGAGRVTCVGYR